MYGEGTPFKLIAYRDLKYYEKIDWDELKGKIHKIHENNKIMKKSELRKTIRKSILRKLQEQKTPDAKLDVSRMQKYFEQFINNRQEYAQLLITLLEFDVPGKKAAFNAAFSDKPSLRAQLVNYYGDEKDQTQSFDYGFDSKQALQMDPETDIEDAIAETKIK